MCYENYFNVMTHVLYHKVPIVHKFVSRMHPMMQLIHYQLQQLQLSVNDHDHNDNIERVLYSLVQQNALWHHNSDNPTKSYYQSTPNNIIPLSTIDNVDSIQVTTLFYLVKSSKYLRP